MQNNLTTAIKASIAAGKAILEVYEQDFSVALKEDDSPLTEADKASNEIINEFLQSTAIPIISEENKQLEFQQRKDWEFCWVVDPLDGTKEFIKKNGEFTVNIALVHQQRPVLGIIYVPVTKELYFANVADGKAFKAVVESSTDAEILHEKAQRIQPSSGQTPTTRVVGSRSHMNEETQNFVNQLRQEGKEVEVVSKGSSLKFCLVAEGLADVYPRYAPTMEWDTAAGQAICEAVGLKVISKETDQPLRYNKENLLNPHFLVSK